MTKGVIFVMTLFYIIYILRCIDQRGEECMTSRDKAIQSFESSLTLIIDTLDRVGANNGIFSALGVIFLEIGIMILSVINGIALFLGYLLIIFPMYCVWLELGGIGILLLVYTCLSIAYLLMYSGRKIILYKILIVISLTLAVVAVSYTFLTLIIFISDYLPQRIHHVYIHNNIEYGTRGVSGEPGPRKWE